MTEHVDVPPAAAPAAVAGTERQAHHESAVPDLLEHGAPVRGQPQTLNTRLFVQLHVFTECLDSAPVVEAVRDSGLDTAVYVNLHDPRGVGVVVMDEDPAVFAESLRALLTRSPFSTLTPVPDFTMFGRTYAQGREQNLEDFLLYKVRRSVLSPQTPWAVWYPLRRIGAYNQLSRVEQGKIMMEHGMLGRRYGEAGLAVDVRLECHGIDRDDNEFVIGLIGSELLPLSKLIKDMRSTRQTSEFIQAMGPFFVGKAIYQSPVPDKARAATG